MKIQIEYTDKNVTSWGGMSLMKELLERSKIIEFLKTLPLPEPQSNRGFSPIVIISSFIVSVWCGATHFAHTALLRYDQVLKQIFDWKNVPSDVTYGRFFKKFTQKMNNELFPKINQWFFEQIHFDNFTLDIDSSVITRYGEQEGSKKGYNPAKRGRNSHHPIMAFVSELRMVANCWLRSGNTSDANNLQDFLIETIDILKNKTIGLLRADSGFYSEKIFWFLENFTNPINYIIAGKKNEFVKRRIKDVDDWCVIKSGTWISEMQYKGYQWSKPRRMIIIRQDMGIKPKCTGKQLFPDELIYQNYRYHTLITNLNLPAEQIWNMYKKRADSENRIEELKYDFAMNGFCLKEFYATEAAMRFVMIAYNLMSLFRQNVLQSKVQHKLSTLRYLCFAIGAWIVKDGNKKILKLSVPVQNRKWFDGLFDRVFNASPPYNFKLNSY